MIETKELKRTFDRGRLVAVDNLNLKVAPGVIHGFVGPNGAGKTTTIKMLTGLIRCCGGSGFIGGHPIGSKAARRLIGYAPERPPMYGDMMAAEFLVYLARIGGMSSAEAEGRAAELLRWLELEDFSKSKTKGFSAGMKQRLGLAQALMHSPDLLILDEPTANLDPTGRTSIIGKLKELNREHGITIFISSHVLSEMEKLVDAVTLISQGKTVAEDSVERLKDSIARNVYTFKTSDNSVAIGIIRAKDYVREIDEDVSGAINVICGDNDTLQQDVMQMVAEKGLRLISFGKKTANLSDVYMKTIGMDGGD